MNQTQPSPPGDDPVSIPLTDWPQPPGHSAPCGLLLITADGFVMDANRTAARWFGPCGTELRSLAAYLGVQIEETGRQLTAFLQAVRKSGQALPLVLPILVLKAWPVVAVSFALYMTVPLFGWNLAAIKDGVWYFNPFTWQLLFVLGAWLVLGGATRFAFLVQSRLVFALSIVYLLFALVMTLAAEITQPLRYPCTSVASVA